MKAGAVAIAIALCAAPAAADEPKQDAPQQQPEQDPIYKIADDELAKGSRLYADEADYAAALQAFEQSYTYVPSWRALNGMALCQQALGRYPTAYNTYRKLFDLFGEQLTADQRARAEEMQREVAKMVGRLRVVADQKGAAVIVDGVKFEPTPMDETILVEIGEHQVVATLDHHQPFATTVTVEGGATRRLDVKLEPIPERVVIERREPSLERPMPGWVPWTTLGAGAAVAGVGGLLALDARGDLRDFDRDVAEMAGDLPRAVDVDDSAVDSAERQQKIALGFAIAGGAAVVTGVVLAIFNEPRATGEKRTTRVIPTRGGVGVAIDF